MKIVLNKEIKDLMRNAKQITERVGKETGFFLYYFRDLQDYLGQYHIFPTELIVGNKSNVDIHSMRESSFKKLGANIVVCGSFHIHSYKKYLDSIDSRMVDENRLAYINECCRNYLSFIDLEGVLDGIIRGNSDCMITCVLSDIEDYVPYYIPKKDISNDEFRAAYNIFIEDQRPSMYTETIYTPEGNISFPTPEYKKRYEYVFSLFDENRFDLYSGDTIIDI